MPRQLAVLAVLVASAASASARPFASHDRVVTFAPGVRAPRPARVLRSDAALPFGWRAQRDRDTGVPAWMWGRHSAPGAIADPAIAERVASAFLAAHADVLAPGSAAADFELVANQLDGATRTIGFRQRASGLPVIGGQIGFVFQRDTLFAITSQTLPDVRAIVPRTPPASAARAEAWIRADTGLAARAVAAKPRAILPLVHGPGDIEYRVVDVLDLAATGAPDRWDVYVSADDGAPIARARTVAFATLVYNAGVRYARGTRMDFPAPAANITVGGTATTTADDGTFACSTNTTVVPGLVGPRVTIVNMAGALATDSLAATCGLPVEWNLSTDEHADAQLSTFVYAGIVKARARRILPSLASWLDTSVSFFVNVAGSCNAYSTGSDTFYYAGSSQCENTGRIADVIYHEFGHSIHNHAFIPGVGSYNLELSEGLADFDAANITEDSGVARGLYYDDTPLRDLSEVRHYPEDISADSHQTGMIEGGSLWDLRVALIAQLGHDPGVAAIEQIYAGVLQRAADIPASYMAALVADTTDGNPMDAPHYCAIERAFGTHGLVPGYVDTAVGTPTLDAGGISVAVTVPSGTDCPPHQVTSIVATYTVDGGAPQTLALATADGAMWTAALPAFPDRTTLRYAIVATLDDGSTRALPNNAADPMYQAYVGPTLPIWCEHFDADPKWAQMTNLAGITEWQWAAPVASSAGDPTAPHDGTHVYGTNITDGGYYHANELTSTTTPAFDVSAYGQVRLQYWRWLTVEDATYDQATIAVDGTTIWTNAASTRGTLDHLDREWRFHDLDLTSYITGGSAAITWQLQSDFSNQFGGWTLDDVCLVGLDKSPKCGDGVLDPGEQCDDGASNGSDGNCTSACTFEIHVGGGGCSTGGGAGGLAALAICVILVGWGSRSRSRSRSRS